MLEIHFHKKESPKLTLPRGSPDSFLPSVGEAKGHGELLPMVGLKVAT